MVALPVGYALSVCANVAMRSVCAVSDIRKHSVICKVRYTSDMASCCHKQFLEYRVLPGLEISISNR